MTTAVAGNGEEFGRSENRSDPITNGIGPKSYLRLSASVVKLFLITSSDCLNALSAD